MPNNQTTDNPHLLRRLHEYQKNKTNKLVLITRFTASILSLLAIGLGLFWYLNSSWVALVFAIIFIAIGLGLFGIAFFIANKLDTFNSIASGAMDFYGMASNTIDAEDGKSPEQPKEPSKQIEN